MASVGSNNIAFPRLPNSSEIIFQAETEPPPQSLHQSSLHRPGANRIVSNRVKEIEQKYPPPRILVRDEKWRGSSTSCRGGAGGDDAVARRKAADQEGRNAARNSSTSSPTFAFKEPVVYRPQQEKPSTSQQHHQPRHYSGDNGDYAKLIADLEDKSSEELPSPPPMIQLSPSHHTQPRQPPLPVRQPVIQSQQPVFIQDESKKQQKSGNKADFEECLQKCIIMVGSLIGIILVAVLIGWLIAFRIRNGALTEPEKCMALLSSGSKDAKFQCNNRNTWDRCENNALHCHYMTEEGLDKSVPVEWPMVAFYCHRCLATACIGIMNKFAKFGAYQSSSSHASEHVFHAKPRPYGKITEQVIPCNEMYCTCYHQRLQQQPLAAHAHRSG